MCITPNQHTASVVDFKTDNYFSGPVQFQGTILVLFSIFIFFQSIIGGIVLLTISSIIFTSHYRLTIDFSKKTYRDYLWILGFKQGGTENFQNIEYLFIRKSKVSQTMNLRSLSSTLRKDVYDGYLRFSETNKIHLITKVSKETLLSKLRPISRQLNVKIIDFSTGNQTEL